MTHNGVSKTKYWQDRTDTARMAICFVRNLWLVLVGIVIGIVLAIACYFLYHAVADGVKYQAYSEFYLDFAADETGEVYQYYNGYTWNDLMSTDLIATETINGLSDGVDIAKIEEDTLAEIKSDIRVLKVTITDSDEKLCADLQAATEKSLVKLGQTAKEFNDISVIKTVTPERIYADNRLFQAIELGAIIGLVLSLIILRFAFVLDDTVYTPTDIAGLDVEMLGVALVNGNDKLANALNKLLEQNEESASGKSKDQINPDDIFRLNAAEFLDADRISEVMDKVQSKKAVIIEVPFKKVKKSVLMLILDTVKQQDAKVLGCIITEASNTFYKAYYGLNGILR